MSQKTTEKLCKKGINMENKNKRAYGLYIHIDDNFESILQQLKSIDVNEKSEVCVVICGSKRFFTFEDFKHRLGFITK